MAAFSDFNVLWVDGKFENVTDRLIIACKLGYDAVAINNFVDDPPPSGKKKSKQQLTIKPADELKVPSEKLQGYTIKQLTRYTKVISESSQASLLRDFTHGASLKYDILAVQPTTKELFSQACQSWEVDVISLDFTERLAFKLKRQDINVALERGVHFEIQYSPAIKDSTVRRHVIANAQWLIDICKGKNIIITSGCKNDIDMRGPYDVANLGLLFGLKESESKDTISRNCRAVLMHAEARRSSKAVMTAIKSSALSNEDHWIVKECRSDDDEDDDDEDDESSEAEPPVKKIKQKAA